MLNSIGLFESGPSGYILKNLGQSGSSISGCVHFHGFINFVEVYFLIFVNNVTLESGYAIWSEGIVHDIVINQLLFYITHVGFLK